MAIVNCSRALRVIVYRQTGPRDIGPWCVQIRPMLYGPYHVARHSTKASAQAHAKRIRAALRGDS